MPVANYPIEVGSSSKGIRAEVVDPVVKQVAEPAYKFKQAVTILPTNAYTNVFLRENPAVSSGPAGNVFKGVPFGANFPQSSDSYQEVSVRVIKHAVEANIAWEHLKFDVINLQMRTIIRRTREIVKSVDDDIYTTLTAEGNLVTSFAVETALHGAWDQTSAAIIDDLMHASRLISERDYPTTNLMCFVSPYDKQSIMNYIASKGAQFPQLATGVVENGRIGTLAGVTLIESNSVPTSQALLVVPKTCATWKEFVPLTSVATEDPLKSWRFRVVEEGILEVTDPYAVVLMRGTRDL